MPLASVIHPISIQAAVFSADLLSKCHVGSLNPTSAVSFAANKSSLKDKRVSVLGGGQKAPCLRLIGPKWASAISFIGPQRTIA